ncbi:MAG: thiamine pyrophosphate-binding protein [Nitrososphaerota archaeon]|nr:thiamine pyrophosphate-binding protein [Nitrososphaerota archaeon]
MASALMGAHNEGSPLIAICTQSESGVSTVRGSELRRFDPKAMFSNLLKWVGFCGEAQDIASYVRSAFRHATVGRKGPVILEVSRSALFGECELDLPLNPKRYRPLNRPEADTGSVRRVLDALTEAKRPVILVGDGVHLAHAWPELRDFARLARIPVVTKSGLSQGYLPEDDSLFAGVSIFNRPSLPTRIVPQADVVLALGCVFDALSAFPSPSSDAKLIQVNLDPAEIGKSGIFDLGIASDPKTFL